LRVAPPDLADRQKFVNELQQPTRKGNTMTDSTASTKDIYTRVTEKIIADLEKGQRAWFPRWQGEHAAGPVSRPLRQNGTPYRGMNVLLLWAESMEKGFNAPIWMTYKQARALGANVRKGEKGSLVVYADTLSKTETNEAGEAVEQKIPFMKGYTVFNAEQVEGLPAHYYAQPVNPLPVAQRMAAVDGFITATGATIRHGGNSAFYAPVLDFVQMPPFENFRDKEGYYATILHELTHWTKNKDRLNREFGRRKFGDEGYAIEELVAEMGAAFLCADLGITPEVREDHIAYLHDWLAVLKMDKRAIFTAAAHAQRAADYLKGLQPKKETEERAAA
jgi:antirestriction protein ArdC